MAEHTPGPWRIDPQIPRRVLSDSLDGLDPLTGENVIGGASPHPHAEANARPIAAAPDLLAALKDAYESLLRLDVSQRISRQSELSACRDAIAKATGRSDQETQDYHTERAWSGERQ